MLVCAINSETIKPDGFISDHKTSGSDEGFESTTDQCEVLDRDLSLQDSEAQEKEKSIG